MTGQPFPQINASFVHEDGTITLPWRSLLQTLWQNAGASTPSFALDTIGNVQGDILYRGPLAWAALAPGTAGFVFTTGGAGGNPSWTQVPAAIATSRIYGNISGGNAQPGAITMSQGLDILGAAQGDVLYRDSNAAGGWKALAPGTLGQLLRTEGAVANPVWDWPEVVTSGIVAAGATQGTATAISTSVSEIDTTAAGTGVIITGLAKGQRWTVFNEGANALNVYPPVGAQIDALGNNNPYLLAAGKCQVFWAISAIQLRSTQLG